MLKIFTPLNALYICCLLICFITTQSFIGRNFNYQKISQFIPPGYEVLDTAFGDLNGDRYVDIALVLRSNNEGSNKDGIRPLVVLFGKAKGNFDLFARNDKVVLCE